MAKAIVNPTFRMDTIIAVHADSRRLHTPVLTAPGGGGSSYLDETNRGSNKPVELKR
jgi:hypothetical protein